MQGLHAVSYCPLSLDMLGCVLESYGVPVLHVSSVPSFVLPSVARDPHFPWNITWEYAWDCLQ
jgi:hypothetical protein